MAAAPPRISIAGLIGAGKSTLALELGAVLDFEVFLEDVKNPVLSDFYRDMAAYSYVLETNLLAQRYKQAHQMNWTTKKGAVQDRSIFEDDIFAKMLTDSGLMDPLAYRTYKELASVMFRTMPAPSVIIYLRVTPAQSLERIRERKRSYEAGITIEYLTKLYHGYEAWIEEIRRNVPVIIIEWGKFHDAAKVAREIAHAWNTQVGIPHTLKLDSE